MGYWKAGFEVTGVDIQEYLNNPFEWFQGDALTFPLDGYDAFHASPPCQDYSVTASLHSAKYPRLIEPIRERLIATGKPYVIENVSGAKAAMRSPILLCGSSFGLGVRRHRLFELSWPEVMVPPCAHYLQPEPIDVTGTGASRLGDREDGGGGNSRKPRNLAHAREVMGIEWMTRPELSEAIPPAYTEWIGERLRTQVEQVAA